MLAVVNVELLCYNDVPKGELLGTEMEANIPFPVLTKRGGCAEMTATGLQTKPNKWGSRLEETAIKAEQRQIKANQMKSLRSDEEHPGSIVLHFYFSTANCCTHSCMDQCLEYWGLPPHYNYMK